MTLNENKNCSMNAECKEINKNLNKCVCKKGFKGDGIICKKSKIKYTDLLGILPVKLNEAIN